MIISVQGESVVGLGHTATIVAITAAGNDVTLGLLDPAAVRAAAVSAGQPSSISSSTVAAEPPMFVEALRALRNFVGAPSNSKVSHVCIVSVAQGYPLCAPLVLARYCRSCSAPHISYSLIAFVNAGCWEPM